MIFLIIFLICMFLTLAVSVMAGVSDFKTLKIPNMYSVYVIAAFLLAYVTLYLGGYDAVFDDFYMHLLSMGLTFLVTFILFALKLIGAGDSKFATACAIWVSLKYMPIYLFFMTLFGSVLGIVALYLKNKKPFKSPAQGSWIEQVQGGASKVPYGIAIAVGLALSFMHTGYLTTGVLSSFL
ncbi:MAG: A24 family peptidase [Alcanivorax sp.]